MKMDHERAGELLLPYVEGELAAAPEVADLEEHLAACSDCRQEEQGLRALLAHPVEPMNDIERSKLHRALRAESGIEDRPPTRTRMAWLPSALSVAALLLVVVVGAQIFQGGPGGSDEESGAEGGADTAGSADEDGGPRPVTLTLSKNGLEADLVSEKAAPVPDEAAPEGTDSDEEVVASGGMGAENGNLSEDSADSTFQRSRESKLVEDRLRRYANRSSTFKRFALAYRVEDVPALRDGFTAELAAGAPADAREQVVECADLVVNAREFPTLPVAAAYGTFQAEKSILLGFVWSPEDTGPLDHFVLYVWPRGTCSTPSHSQIGRVATGKG